LEEYAPEVIYIKGTHNTVADAILQLDYDPKLNTANEYTHAMLGVEPEELSLQQWKSFLCTIGKATTRAAPQRKPTAFI
jgi:hypothetical protein